jgi:hypothetical protein
MVKPNPVDIANIWLLQNHKGKVLYLWCFLMITSFPLINN